MQISTPAARNTYLFKDTPVFNSTGDTEKIPKASFDFCTFQTQLYFIPARMMWRMAEGSEGELRACRGNGAENSSQSKVGGGVFLGEGVGEGGRSHPREEGVQSPCPWGGGADSQQTACPQGDVYSHCPFSLPLIFSSCSSLLDHKTIRHESSSTTSLT